MGTWNHTCYSTKKSSYKSIRNAMSAETVSKCLPRSFQESPTGGPIVHRAVCCNWRWGGRLPRPRGPFRCLHAPTGNPIRSHKSGRQPGAPRRRRHNHTYTHSKTLLKGIPAAHQKTNFKQDYPDHESAFTPNLDPPSRKVTLPTMGLRNFLAPSWNFSRNLIFPSRG